MREPKGRAVQTVYSIIVSLLNHLFVKPAAMAQDYRVTLRVLNPSAKKLGFLKHIPLPIEHEAAANGRATLPCRACL